MEGITCPTAVVIHCQDSPPAQSPRDHHSRRLNALCANRRARGTDFRPISPDKKQDGQAPPDGHIALAVRTRQARRSVAVDSPNGSRCRAQRPPAPSMGSRRSLCSGSGREKNPAAEGSGAAMTAGRYSTVSLSSCRSAYMYPLDVTTGGNGSGRSSSLVKPSAATAQRASHAATATATAAAG
ncbi:hypothetical protein ON010_g18906 [Phytophthora cinnamomi]|nr:hypothetical protein ON010_g18906 [Phytophthora cinnamomi]